jgi:hypothetical protein
MYVGVFGDTVVYCLNYCGVRYPTLLLSPLLLQGSEESLSGWGSMYDLLIH